MEMALEPYAVTMAQNLKTLDLKPFAVIWVLSISFSHPMSLAKMGVV
jgi:hypothetical protein